MKLTNQDIVNKISILSKYNDKKLPQRISFAIAKNLGVLSEQYQIYEQELKEVLLSHDNDLQKDEHGNTILSSSGVPYVIDDASEELRRDLAQLLGSSVDIDFNAISLEEFDYSEDYKYDALAPREITELQKALF